MSKAPMLALGPRLGGDAGDWDVRATEEGGANPMRDFVRTILRRVMRNDPARSLPPPIRQIIRRVRAKKLTYLSDAKLAKLGSLCLANERNGVPGALIETGCALGGSSIVMAAAKERSRSLRVYDVFGQIPPPSDRDGADVHERYQVISSGKARGLCGDTYYGYLDDLYDRVAASFRELGYPIEENNVELIKGLVQDTLAVAEPVSLAHIDVDWYEPVRTSLERIEPWLSVGGAIVADDYLD